MLKHNDEFGFVGPRACLVGQLLRPSNGSVSNLLQLAGSLPPNIYSQLQDAARNLLLPASGMLLISCMKRSWEMSATALRRSSEQDVDAEAEAAMRSNDTTY